MAEEWKKIESLVEQVKEYVNTRVSQAKLSAAEKTAKVSSLLIAIVLMAMLFFLFFTVLSIGIAMLIGELLGHWWMGFFIVAIGIAIIGVWAWASKSKLLQIPIMNALIAILFNEDDEKGGEK